MDETPPPYKEDLSSYNGDVEDAEKATWEFLLKRHRTYTLLALLATIAVIVPDWYLVYLCLTWGADIQFLILLGALPFLIPFFIYIDVHAHMQLLFQTQLAKTLGLTFSAMAPVSSASGILFTLGTEQEPLINILSGMYRGLPLRFFHYIYVTGSGKNRTSHAFTVCELTLPNDVPELIVKDTKLIPGYVGEWRGTSPLTLEGTFNRNFDVRVADGKEVEALQVLEPNVMEKLMKDYAGYGFECSGDRLNIFTEKQPRSKTAYTQMVKLADGLIDKLVPELAVVARTEDGARN